MCYWDIDQCYSVTMQQGCTDYTHHLSIIFKHVSISTTHL